MKSYKAACDMFEIMEAVKKIYKGGTTPKTPIRVDYNRDSHGRKQKGGESASPTKTPRKAAMESIR